MTKLFQIRRGHPAPSPAMASSLGGKAYNQALAAADGLPVPDGLVLPADVFPGRPWVDALPQAGAPARAAAVAAQLATCGIDLLAELAALGGARYAVRSSADVEDLPVASFAGSFSTVLSVPPTGVLAAVADVWASTFQDRVDGYLRDRGLGDRVGAIRMAVLIQPLIPPLLAGVALSHAPGRSNDPRIAVNVVRGLGEALVSGTVTPQSFLLERGTWALVALQDAIDIDLCVELASDIGRTIELLELRRGSTQDIEFAVTNDLKFVLLQNRPIAQRQKVAEVR